MDYITNIIPKNTPHKRRPAIPLKSFDYITIHNTGNPSSNAKGERAWLTNPTNDREASFHIVIDQVNAIECIPTGLKYIFPNTSVAEVAWHAGDGEDGTGNTRSIGIEICESGDYSATMKNAITLVALILFKSNKSINIIKQHHDWSGKDCPRILRRNNLWPKFINDVTTELTRLKGASVTPVAPTPVVTPVTKPTTPIVTIAGLESWQQQMGENAITALASVNLLTTPDAWKLKLGENTPNWLFFEMTRRVYEKLMQDIMDLRASLNK
jgi:N-acetylmuramoyl-L-alanine amidase